MSASESGSKAQQPWTTNKHPASTSALIASLEQLRQSNPKAVRANVHLYPASIYAEDDRNEEGSTHHDRYITSWKMTEHMYFNANNQFPTLSRGLFTEEVREGEEVPQGAERYEGQWDGERKRARIVARGYDKFFNIDEVAWTNWTSMRKHTTPPYQLTLKSNGCLILIAALTPSHLLVASKHSLGTTAESQSHLQRDEVDTGIADGIKDLSLKDAKTKNKGKQAVKKSTETPISEADAEREAQAHAEVGRQWLKKTLAASGKSEPELARRLWRDNLTAVLELCDDSFEEHVIATPEYWTGLHLHGLNHNTPHFSTAPPSDVTSFAAEFGFIQTKYVELNTLDEVRSFANDVALTGSWQGDLIEGFVVRCIVGESTGTDKPPYRPGAPFFFKIKFDEPYLLYRQWREMTRVMLPLLDNMGPEKEAAVWKAVRKKVRRPEVAVYADWCTQTMKADPNLFHGFDRGVVRVRERFLKWVEHDGSQAWASAKADNYKLKAGKAPLQAPTIDRSELPKKHMIVPIAVPGCGKTLIGVALSQLFGFGHTQSDDVTAKRSAPTFLKAITALLQKKDVVYADRNNHIDKHYDELSKLASDKSMNKFNLRLIAVVWDVESQPYHRLLRICSERVVRRGDNHQTLRPDLTAEAEHEAVVGSFLRNWTTPDPALFDTIITVQVRDSSRECLGKIVDGLADSMEIPKPSDNDIDAALKAAQEYKVTTPYHAPAARVGKAIRYFGVAPEIDFQAVMISILSKHPEPAAQAFFDSLSRIDRITPKPHITLAHEKVVAAEKEIASSNSAPGPMQVLWDKCKSLAETGVSPIYEFDFTCLVWDDRVMTLGLDNLRPRPGSSDDAPQLDVPDEIRLYLHVTVGTKAEEISAYESRGIVRVANEAMANGGNIGNAAEVAEGGGEVRWIRLEDVTGQGRVRGMY